MRLTQRSIKTLGPGRYGDSTCKTLQLLVTPTGGRSWVQRLVVNGRRLDRGLGSVEFVTLAEARETAARNRFIARRGGQPFAQRTRETAPTFADAARLAEAANRGRWAPASLKAWQGTMRRHVLPKLGTVKLSALNRQHVIDCLASIKAVSEARKARQRISTVVEYALAREWIAENVCKTGNGIDAALPHLKASQDCTHHAAAPHADVAGIMARLAAGPPGGSTVRACLRFLILTACRSDEARGATWAEIDTAGRVWTIPAARAKTGRDHRVPLSDAALAILEERRGLHARLVFASEWTGSPLSGQGLMGGVKGDDVTVHGFRSSFTDWAGDTGRDSALAQHALAHNVGTATERAYARSDLFDRRRGLMDDWADYIA